MDTASGAFAGASFGFIGTAAPGALRFTVAPAVDADGPVTDTTGPISTYDKTI